MIRLIAIAGFAVAVATSVQAMTLPQLHQQDGLMTQVREACGAGRVRINGVCVARTTTRHGCLQSYCWLMGKSHKRAAPRVPLASPHLGALITTEA